MTRNEWLFILALALITITSLSFAPPQGTYTPVATETSRAEDTTPLTGPSPTATATATAKAAASPSPSPTEPPTRTPTATRTPTLTPTLGPTPFPFDTHAELDRYIYVDQLTQFVYVFQYGQLLRAIPCSAGLPHSDKYTPAWSGRVGAYIGTFFAFDVYADEAWYLFQSEGGILIHSLPYLWEDDVKVYQDRDALGVRPASHGCVRIAPEEAEWLTNWNPAGVQITVSDPYLDKWRALEAEAGGW
ncbi:MAG: L,D-transpeptidase [Anaerolineae bacterium]